MVTGVAVVQLGTEVYRTCGIKEGMQDIPSFFGVEGSEGYEWRLST